MSIFDFIRVSFKNQDLHNKEEWDDKWETEKRSGWDLIWEPGSQGVAAAHNSHNNIATAANDWTGNL